VSEPKNTRHLRIDEHATYQPKPTRRRGPPEAWMNRNRQDKGILNGPSETDEHPETREEALKRAGAERINPILATKFIDELIKRCL
jgi:hypothetical protein